VDVEPHGQLLPTAERGCLVVADISGYTAYLHASELEHAHDVLADLLDTVVRNLRATLRVNRLEGDAAFAYALEETIEASMLLDTIEETYFAFRGRVRDIRHATTCECNACLLIPDLDLKFLVHHGQFVRQDLSVGEELTGTDVVLVHRLLKNSVSAAFHLRGYVLFTQACIEALGIDPDAAGMRPHKEHYDDVGTVTGWVEDLEQRWQFEDERRRVYLLPAAAGAEFVRVLAAPAPLVWEFATSPQKRMLWLPDVDRIDEDAPAGRRGVGTTSHCVHGRSGIVEEILDWRPFRYFTIRQVLPGYGPVVMTWELRPRGEDATELTARIARPQGRRQRVLWRLGQKRFTAQGEELMDRLEVALAVHSASATAAT
jgi:uncharacterized protein YndB with AHSA1/START domain